MQITYHKNYQKAFDKLPPKQQLKIVETLERFAQNPHDKSIQNHELKGNMKGLRAISAGGDLRLIFREVNNYQLVKFILVGTHNQV